MQERNRLPCAELQDAHFYLPIRAGDLQYLVRQREPAPGEAPREGRALALTCTAALCSTMFILCAFTLTENARKL